MLRIVTRQRAVPGSAPTRPLFTVPLSSCCTYSLTHSRTVTSPHCLHYCHCARFPCSPVPPASACSYRAPHQTQTDRQLRYYGFSRVIGRAAAEHIRLDRRHPAVPPQEEHGQGLQRRLHVRRGGVSLLPRCGGVAQLQRSQ